jgi:Fructose-bisphosphate aldolase class-I
VLLEGTLLKPNWVAAGIDHQPPATPEEVAKWTVQVLVQAGRQTDRQTDRQTKVVARQTDGRANSRQSGPGWNLAGRLHSQPSWSSFCQSIHPEPRQPLEATQTAEDDGDLSADLSVCKPTSKVLAQCRGLGRHCTLLALTEL